MKIFKGLRPTAGQGPNKEGEGRERKGRVVPVGVVVVVVVVVVLVVVVVVAWVCECVGACLGACVCVYFLPFSGYVVPSWGYARKKRRKENPEREGHHYMLQL